MAKGGFDRLTGSVGNLNFFQVNGEQRVRLKAHHHTSKRTVRRKRTPAQALQLARFKFASQFVREVKDLFNQSFETVGPQIGKCQAIRYLLSQALYGDEKNLKVNFSKLLVARGPALGATGVQVSSSVPGTLDFTWEDNSGDSRGSENDEAILVAYNEKEDYFAYTMKGGARKHCKGSLVAGLIGGQEYHTWVSFVRKNGSTADSVYCGVAKS